jgi:hypothetical protein
MRRTPVEVHIANKAVLFMVPTGLVAFLSYVLWVREFDA